MLQEAARVKTETQKRDVMQGSVDMLANFKSQEAPTKSRSRNIGGQNMLEPEPEYQGEKTKLKKWTQLAYASRVVCSSTLISRNAAD